MARHHEAILPLLRRARVALAGMTAGVNALEVAGYQVRVDLCRFEVTVAENGLHVARRSAVEEEMDGARAG